jgi:two-component system, chemotaxis family, chemotaxis protein CheY
MTKLVVIVEDAESLAASLAVALETIPTVKVIVTHHPVIALRAFKNTSPPIAAIVTDLNLPEVSGIELIQMVRQMDGYASLPAILMSAEVSALPANGNIISTPNAIFQKPFSLKEVCRVLESLLL